MEQLSAQMWTRQILLVALVALVAMVGGCGFNVAPVLNYSGQPVVAPSNVNVGLNTVHDVILVAIADRGWTVDSDEPGRFYASISTGGHGAQVKIDYTTTAYSIEYVTSTAGLKYDGTSIHRRYNTWVKNLQQAIATRFSQLQPGPAAPTAQPTAEPAPPQADAAGGSTPVQVFPEASQQ